MNLTWKASFSASCFHAAGAILAGRTLVDSSLEKSLKGPSHDLANEIEAVDLPREVLLARLIELSTEIENNRQLVEQATIKILGAGRVNPVAIDALAGRIARLENAFRQAVPHVVDELAVRGEPLKQQWESRGPGLLQCLARHTEEGLLVSSAQVVLVHPVLGGAGAAHLLSNKATIEAVLANPHPELPEALRLGWLLSQLNMEVPIYGELVPSERLPRITQLAMLPALLAAAVDVEWAVLDRETLELALVAWQIVEEGDPAGVEQTATSLLDWWKTYQESNPRWAVALAALDRTLRV